MAVLMAGALMGPAVVIAPHAGAAGSVSLLQGAVAGQATKAQGVAKFRYVTGIAQVAKGYPIRGGKVRAESLRGKRLPIAWRSSRAGRHTQPSGAFSLPSKGLPKHFVVVVQGGRVHGRKAKGTFRAVAAKRNGAINVSQVSLGTTVQTDVYRSMRGKRGYSARVLRKAHNRTLRSVRLPRYLVLGWDDRVNPRFIRGARLQRYAKKYGGYGPLARRVEWLVRHNKTIPLSAQVARSRQVSSTDVVDDCADAVFGFTPEALAECAASGALAIVSAAFGPSPSSEVLGDLQQINTDLAGLSQQLSDLQAGVNSDFLDLVADEAQDEYDAAARELLATSSAIQAQLISVAQLAANIPGKAPAILVNQQLTALMGNLDPDTPGSVLSNTTATELAAGTVATGASGLGTLPAAWQAVRAEQQTGSLGATTNGDAALGQGTTLYTNEMSQAFAAPGAYWFNQLWLLGVLTANYYNYLYTEDGLTPAQVTAETADVIGGFSDSGTCPGPAPSPSPIVPQVACPGSISANLWQQIETAPMTVPPGTVIDSSTDHVWGSAFLNDVTGTVSGSGLPNDPSTGNPMVPELLNQVNGGATGPWPGVNANLLALATADVADQGTWSWSVPTANMEGLLYDAATSPQFGSVGGSSGLLGGLGSGNNPNNLGGITSPPAFPSTLDMWANSNFWAFNVGLGTGWLPSGVIQYLNDCDGTPQPQYAGFNGFCGSSSGNPPQFPPKAVSAPVVLNASIPGEYYQYPAAYPKALLLDPQELIYQISLFRYVQPPPNPQ